MSERTITMNIAIVLAGGTGSRVGSNIPKQFIEVCGKPIMAYTVGTLQNNNNIDEMMIVCHKDYLDIAQNIVNEYSFTKVKWIVEGGASFPESTYKGLSFLKDKISSEDIVIVHGSCAPLVTDDVINDAVCVAQKHKTAMAKQEMALSTCIKSNECYSTQSIDRERIIQVQFPLAFQYGYIMACYESCIKRGTFKDLGLHLQYAVFDNGGTMYFSKGDEKNFKITTQADIDLFEGYLLLKEKRRKENASV